MTNCPKFNSFQHCSTEITATAGLFTARQQRLLSQALIDAAVTITALGTNVLIDIYDGANISCSGGGSVDAALLECPLTIAPLNDDMIHNYFLRA